MALISIFILNLLDNYVLCVHEDVHACVHMCVKARKQSLVLPYRHHPHFICFCCLRQGFSLA